ncbi:oligosaccharide flippase family protein [Gammaproteobacteria bacterium]|nr:oligosaccharide flippase family protein [Gammaproteobacteria bacterium]MDA8957335.1 oligosaccharide flippase family protein [Gammaproteobacteria bacterium]MDA9039439.1 oligosaccharide flippase family protein [Gammaproteobacteria bacterium]
MHIKETLYSILDTQLSKNISSLYLVQITRYLIPLLMIPYIARVLGVSSWGILAFTQAFSLYLFLIVDYGFELSATRMIAENKGNHNKLAKILVNVLSAKLFLSFLVIILAVIIKEVWNNIFDISILYWAGFFWAFSNSINLFWFFQGIERVQFIAFIDVASKLIGLALIFYFVKSPGDEWVFLAINGGASFVTFLISFIYLARNFGIFPPSLKDSISMIDDGWNSFLIRFFSSIYSSTSPFIMGLISTPELVGYYSAAEKITRTVKEILRPITRTLYPHFSVLLKNDRNIAFYKIRLAFLSLSIIGLLLALLVYLFSDSIITLMFGGDFKNSILILQIMSIIILLSTMSNVISIQWMMNNNLDKKVAIYTFISLLIFITAAILLVPIYDGKGMALSIILAELSLITICVLALKKYKLI